MKKLLFTIMLLLAFSVQANENTTYWYTVVYGFVNLHEKCVGDSSCQAVINSHFAAAVSSNASSFTGWYAVSEKDRDDKAVWKFKKPN